MADSEMLSAGTKAGIAVIGGGSVVAIAVANMHHPEVLAITLIGVALALCIVFGYSWAAKWWSQRKGGESIGKGLEEDSRNLPIRASGESQARAQELRAKFVSGLSVLGPELYAYPWYLVVGERSGGKTFLIERGTRDIRSGDEVPGLGGTINMNWWFTESAVFLDTAGTLMMPEIDTGNNELWEGFLKMLGAKRRDCPINGVILVIPADTLQTDADDRVDDNARKIANELGKVRRLFQMRFPIFVVVTKCDKIIGFREFFEAVSDEGQMLGWSNPDLDAPFDPTKLTEHFKSVRAALIKRRFHLLRNPVVQSNSSALRLNEVDALYKFPDRLTKLGERLQRYVRPIFARGAGSPKPLFFRGVYFTSSLQQGSAVDITLASILGRTPEELKMVNTGDADTISHRSLFVGDTFKKKILLEGRLVTREDSVKSLTRRRRVQMLAAAMAACFLLIGATAFQRYDLKNRIESHEELWAALNPQTDRPVDSKIVSDTGKYRGEATPLRDADVVPAMKDKTIIQMHKAALEDLERPFDPPLIFWFTNRINGKDYVPQKVAAYRAFFQRSVLIPLERNQLTNLQDPALWKDSESATRALTDLIRLRWPVASAATDSTTVPGEPELANLLGGVQHSAAADPSAGDEDQAILLRGYHQLVAMHNVSFDGDRTLEGDITKIVRERFLTQWNGSSEQRQHLQDAAASLSKDLKQFEAAAQSLVRLLPWDMKPLQDGPKLAAFVQKWKSQTAELEQAHHDVLDDLKASGWQKAESFSKFYSDKIVGLPQAKAKACQQLLDAIGGGAELPDVQRDLKQQVAEAHNELKAGPQDELLQELQKQNWLLTSIDEGTDAHELALNLDFEVLEQGPQLEKISVVVPTLSEQLQAVDDGEKADRETVARDIDFLKKQSADRIDKLGEFANFTIDISARQQRQQMVEQALAKWPVDEPWLQTALQSLGLPAAEQEAQFAALPVLHLQNPPVEFHPARMQSLLDFTNEIDRALRTAPDPIALSDPKTLVEKFKVLKVSVSRLKKKYDEYWKDTAVKFDPDPTSWDKDVEQIKKFSSPDVLEQTNKDLATIDDFRSRALNISNPLPDTRIVSGLIRNWAALAVDPSPRQRLLDMKLADFKAKFVYDRSTRDGVGDRYWDALFNRFMGEASDSFAQQTSGAYKNLAKLASKFPLNPSLDAEDISPEELKEVTRQIAIVTGAKDPVAGTLRALNETALQSLPQNVQDSVTKLWNGGLSQTELDWITQVQAFSNVLTRNQIQYGIYAVRLDDVGNPWYASALECGLTINRNGLGCGVHANHVVAAVPILLSGPNASLPDDRFFDATTGPKELVFQCFINGAVDLDRTFVLARGRWAGLRLASKGTWDEKQQGYMWDNSLPAAPFQGGGTPQTCRIPLLIRLFRPSSPTVGIQVKFPDNAP